MKEQLSNLSANPINDEIYSPTDLSDLMHSIKTHGQLEPIVVDQDNQILSGHRRYYAMRQMGWTECEVRVQNTPNPIITLIEYNRYRQKSVSDILNESRFLERELRTEIGRGRNAAIERGGKRMTTVLALSEKLGVSQTQIKKIRTIANYEPALVAKVDSGELSLDKAYNEIRERYLVKGTKQKTLDNEISFKDKFRKLLTEYQPTTETIQSVIADTYPYSVSSMSGGEQRRDELINQLDQLKRLDSRDLTFYQKILEVRRLKPDPHLVKKVEKKIWVPSDIYNRDSTIKEIEQLEPVVEIVSDDDLEEFNILRVGTTNMEWVRGPGRSVKCVVINRRDGRYLGVITLASDFRTLDTRDSYIGWNDEQRKERLTSLAVMNTCHATQPFGHNMLGVKLVASLSTTDTVRQEWKSKYGDPLVGITTTSLHGSFSVYQSNPYFKHLGETKGIQSLSPEKEEYEFWRGWVKENYYDEYMDARTDRSSPKQNILRLIFRKLDIDPNQYRHEHHRGVFYADMYENSRDYLCGKTDANDLVLTPKYAKSGAEVFENWKPKIIARYEKLHSANTLQPDTLFYDDLDDNLVDRWLLSKNLG